MKVVAALSLAVMLAAYASSAIACVPNQYLPFVMNANVRQSDGVWRTLEISSYGVRDDDADMTLSWTLRIHSRSTNKAAVIDVIRGEARIFPLRPSAMASVRNTTVEGAGLEFGLPAYLLQPADALHRSEYGPSEDVRSFAGRPCGFRQQQNGAWACFDRAGIALAAGPRIGELNYRVVSFSETHLGRSAFAIPDYPIAPSGGGGGGTRLTC